MIFVLSAAFAEPAPPAPAEPAAAPVEAPAPPAAPALPPEAARHDELRALRTALLAAVETRDLDALGGTVTEDVVFTGMDGRVARGRAGLRSYVESMLTGPGAVVKDVRFAPTSDELSIFLGDGRTALAWGPSHDTYVFTDGTEVAVDTRWSATLVRDDAGAWHVASFHASVPVFDNPLLATAKTWVPVAGLSGLAAGTILGIVTGFLLGRRR